MVGLTGLTSAPVSAAPSPGINNQINFQGRLLNSAGAVIADGNYNMQFKIYKNGDGLAVGDTTCTITDCASTAGTLLWTESWLGQASHSVVVKNGYFSVNLGSITTLVGVDFNQPVMWLSMDVAAGAYATDVTCTPFSSCTPDPEMLPMKRLGSAVYAMNAGQLGGIASSGYIQNVAPNTTQQTANINILSGAAANVAAAQIQAVASATAPVLIVKGGATPGSGGDLLQLQNSSSAVMAKVDATGNLTAAGTITGTLGLTASNLSTAGIVTNTAGGVLGSVITVPIANGGTAASTAANARLNLATAQASTGTNCSTVCLNSIISADTRAVVDAPQDRNAGLYVDFKANATNSLSDGGTYNGVLNVRPYGSGSDFSGGQTSQLAVTDNGNLWIRTSTNATTWGTWYQECSTKAVCSGYAPATGGTGYIQNQNASAQATSNFWISGNGTLGGTLAVTGAVTGGTYNSQTISAAASFTGTVAVTTSVSTPTLTTASGDLTIDPVGNTVVKGSTSVTGTAALDIQNSTASILYARNDGNIGIGTTTPVDKLQVVGNTYIGSSAGTTPAYLYLYGNGTAGVTSTLFTSNGNLHIDAAAGGSATYLNYWRGTGGVMFGNGATGYNANVSAAGVYAGTGLNVGAGTITSGLINSQTISATANFTGTLAVATSVSTPTLTTASGNLTIDPVGDTIVKGSTSVTGTAALDIQNSTASILYARNDGNIGIGTTAPGAKLDIDWGGATNPRLQLAANTTNGADVDVRLFRATGAGSNFTSWYMSNITGDLSFQYGASAAIGSQTVSPMVTFQAATGNVGIGTTSPAAKLHVVGATYLAGDLGVSGLSGVQSQANNFNLAPNSSFEVKTNSTGTDPDGWVSSSIPGNGTATTARATDAQSDGAASMKSVLTNTTSSSHFTSTATNFIPVKGSTAYMHAVDVVNDVTANTCGNGLYVRVDWYTAAQAYISYSDTTSNGATTTTWTTYSGTITSPSNATFAKLDYYSFQVSPNANGCTRWFDNDVFRPVGFSGAASFAMGSGTVGIGNTNTTYKLDVTGDVNLSGNLLVGATNVISSARVLQNVTADTGILTSGTLPVGRGGTGVTSTPTNGQLLFGNGTNYTVGTLGATGLTVTPGVGTLSLAVNYGSGANQAAAGANTFTCPTVSGTNLSGGGGTVTLGTSGTACTAIGFTATPSFTTITSTQATGTAPLTVASTTVVTNLNADLLDGQHAAAFQAAGNYLVQAPAATATNTISPTGATTGLTVNGSATATLAMNVLQGQAADGVNIALSSATTNGNGLLVSRAAAGTTTNGLSVTNATGTTTNGLQLTQTSGTFTTGINFTGTFGNLIVAPSFSVTNAGAVTGGTYNSQTISAAASFTGTVVAATSVSAPILISTVATGTAPLTVTSTTVVTNLNADLLDGQHGAYYATATGGAGYIQAQAATPGTAQNTNFNLGTGVGIAATYNATTGINTGATSGTQRIDASGNLVNIGNITGLGAVTLGSAAATTLTVDSGTVGALNIGTSANAKTITLGNTTSGTGTTVQGGATKETINNAGALIQTTTNSTTAFQVQNAAGAPIFLVDTSTTSNLVSNPGFEVNTSTGWTYTNATGTQNLTKLNIYHGLASNSVNVTVAGGGANATGFTVAITPAQYTFSFYAEKGTNAGTLSVAITGGTTPACTLVNYVAPVTTGFQRYTCTFTSTTSNVTAISINSSATGTFFLDAVELNTGATAAPYAAQGAIQLRGIINNPLTLQNTADSTSAFQIQNAAGTGNNLVVDTLNGSIGVGTAGPSYRLDVQGGDINTSGVIRTGGTQRLDASGNLSSIGTIGSGAITSTSTLQGTQFISTVATGTAPLTVTSTTVVTNLNADLLDGQHGAYYATATGGAGYIQNQNASAQATSNFWISGSGTAATSFIAPTYTTAAATALTITGHAASTWSTDAGNLTVTASAGAANLILDAGTSGSGTVQLGNSTANTINIGNNAIAHTIAIGTAGAAQAITIGSQNTTSATTIYAGTGNINLRAGAIELGSANVATTLQGAPATGTNASGKDITIDASNGTGSGGSGALIFRTSNGTTGSQITKDAAASNNINGNTVLTWTHVTASQSNRLLIVGIGTQKTTTPASTVTAVTYNGVALTKSTAQAGPASNGWVDDEVWYLVAPPVGSFTVSVTVSATSAIAAGSLGLYNVDQTTPLPLTNSNSGSTANPSITLSGTNSNQWVVNVMANETDPSTPSVGMTAQWSNTTGNAGSFGSTGPASLGSTTTGYTTTANNWAQIAVAVNPIGGSYADSLSAAMRINQNGSVLMQNSLNSTTAFQVQNSAGTNALNVDTTLSVTSMQGTASIAVLGSELITTTDFTNAVWTKTGWTVTSTTATHNTGNTSALSTSQVTVTAGATYKVTYTVSGAAADANQVTPAIGGTNGQKTFGNTTETQLITATNTGALSFTPYSAWIGVISSVSVKLVTAANAVMTIKNSDATVGLEVRAGGSGLLNNFIGVSAGQSNTTGTSNTGFGDYALQSNTTGTHNAAIGKGALQNNTTGYQNTAAGELALQANTTGYANTAIGNAALNANTTGYNNTAVGLNSLVSNTNGYQNVAMGNNAAWSESIGYQNTAIGANALWYNQTGSGNTAVGYGAGTGVANNSFANNSLFGDNAGLALTTGSNNELMGFQAGDNLTSGSNNIILGYNINAPSATSANTLNIGNLIFGTGLDGSGNTLSTGAIGIGLSDPSVVPQSPKFVVKSNGVADNNADTATTMQELYADHGGNSVRLMFKVQNVGSSCVDWTCQSVILQRVVDVSDQAYMSFESGSICIQIRRCTHTFGVQGTIGASGAITANTTPDLSETIPAAPGVETADVVMADPNNTERVVKSDRAYNSAVVGVISDGSSSFMINSYGGSEGAALTGKPMVLAGRVPVKVTDEGGAVRPGDYLTSSSTPGYAMKATHAGSTIGKALGFFDSAGSGTVLALINISYFDPNSGTAMQGNFTDVTASGSIAAASASITGEVSANTLNVIGAANVGSLTVEGNAAVGGTLAVVGDATIQGSLAVAGNTSVMDMTIGGHITTAGDAPAATVLTSAGTNATVTITGDDTSGTITVTTGDPHEAATRTTAEVLAPTAGDLAQLTFAKQFGAAPRIMLSPTDKDSAPLLSYPSTTDDKGFVLGITTQPSPQKTYKFNYWITQ